MKLFLAAALALLLLGCVGSNTPIDAPATPIPPASVNLSIDFNGASPSSFDGKESWWEYSFDLEGWFVRNQQVGETIYHFTALNGMHDDAVSVLETAGAEAGFIVKTKFFESYNSKQVESVDGVANGDYGRFWHAYVNGKLVKQGQQSRKLVSGGVIEWIFEEETVDE